MKVRAVLLVAMILAGGSAVQAAPPDPSRPVPVGCFCLRHTTGQVVAGCKAFKGVNDFYARAECRGVDGGKSNEFRIDDPWTVVLGGQEGCVPCTPKPRSGPPDMPRSETIPRGGQ